MNKMNNVDKMIAFILLGIVTVICLTIESCNDGAGEIRGYYTKVYFGDNTVWVNRYHADDVMIGIFETYEEAKLARDELQNEVRDNE